MTPAWLLALSADQAAAASSLPSAASAVGQLAPAAPSWWRVAAMLVVLALLLLVWWKVNRGRLGWDRLLKPGAQRLVLGEQRWLNGRTLVCIVEVDGERFLLAQTNGALAWQPLAGKAGVPAPKTD